MTDNKPKIDLKSRLKAKTVGAQGGPAIPPPVGIPKPAVPSTPTTRRPPAPAYETSNPYASVPTSAIPVKAEPQAIRVEMSAEILEAQKGHRTRNIAVAVAAGLVSGLLGFAVGDRSSSSKAANQAVDDAKSLREEVEAATTTARQLADVLKSAREKLKGNKYPKEEISKLAEINLPFGGEQLAGRNIARFKKEALVPLLQFASGSQQANDQKKSLHLVIASSSMQKGLQDFLDQQDETKRKVRWMVVVGNGPHGPWGSIEPLDKDQWFIAASKQKGADGKDYAWPEKFKIKDGNKTVEFPRYTSGDPTGSSPKIIPVDPTSQSGACPADVVGRVGSEINRVETMLRGDATPGDEKVGLIDLGDKVVEELKKIGQP